MGLFSHEKYCADLLFRCCICEPHDLGVIDDGMSMRPEIHDVLTQRTNEARDDLLIGRLRLKREIRNDLRVRKIVYC